MSAEHRYEITVLVGPCSSSEVEALTDAVADVALGKLGACVSQRRLSADESSSIDSYAELVRARFREGTDDE